MILRSWDNAFSHYLPAGKLLVQSMKKNMNMLKLLEVFIKDTKRTSADVTGVSAVNFGFDLADKSTVLIGYFEQIITSKEYH